MLLWKCNKYYMLWVHVCSLIFPRCNTDTPFCLLWLVQLYNIFPHCVIKDTIFGKTLLNIKRLFSLSLQRLFQTFFVLRRIQRDIITNVRKSSFKVPVILVSINETWIFLDKFSKNFHTKNLIQIRPVGAELFDGDEQIDSRTYWNTDMTKPIFAFRNFANGGSLLQGLLKHRLPPKRQLF